MSYCFPPELQQIVRQELASGELLVEDELLLEAVRLLHQREEDLRNFKAQLQGRLDRLDRGEVIELEGETAFGKSSTTSRRGAVIATRRGGLPREPLHPDSRSPAGLGRDLELSRDREGPKRLQKVSLIACLGHFPLWHNSRYSANSGKTWAKVPAFVVRPSFVLYRPQAD